MVTTEVNDVRGRTLQQATMYRIIFRTLVAPRSSSVNVYDSCVLAAKCDKTVFR